MLIIYVFYFNKRAEHSHKSYCSIPSLHFTPYLTKIHSLKNLNSTTSVCNDIPLETGSLKIIAVKRGLLSSFTLFLSANPCRIKLKIREIVVIIIILKAIVDGVADRNKRCGLECERFPPKV